MAQRARDGRQSLEMVGARALGRDQQKDEVDRQAVERLEIDRPLQPREALRSPAFILGSYAVLA